MSELAGLCEAKSEVLWEDWQDAHNSEGPVMNGDWLSGLTRQTQELDFSGLVQRSYQVKEKGPDDEELTESIAGSSDKSGVLAMLDVLEKEELKQQALAVSHSENVSEWIESIAAVIREDKAQRLIDIARNLKMPIVTVWLAALLGSFKVEQRGGFYTTDEIWISARSEKSVVFKQE